MSIQLSLTKRRRDEGRVARALAEFLQMQRRTYAMGAGTIDWVREDRRLTEVLLAALGPTMLRMILAGTEDAEDAIGPVPLTGDMGAVTEAYIANQAGRINRATRSRIGNAQQRLLDTDDQDRFLSDILGAFGAAAAVTLGVTATTGAYSMGSQLVADSVERSGYIVETVWHAERDACPICQALNGTTKESGAWTQPPPSPHPNCRCWISHTYREPEVVGRNAPFTAEREALQVALDKDRLYAHSRALMAAWRRREGRTF